MTVLAEVKTVRLVDKVTGSTVVLDEETARKLAEHYEPADQKVTAKKAAAKPSEK